MLALGQGFAVLVALIHVYILILEMFLWTKARGLATFKMTITRAEETKILAANQGLYNGFLASGILWGLLREDTGVVCFFLICVAIAGVYGSMTVGKKILYIQTVPAVLALLLLFLA
jgi:putative membrane protein